MLDIVKMDAYHNDMELWFRKTHNNILHSKLAIFGIVALLILISSMVVFMGRQVAQLQSIDTASEASGRGGDGGGINIISRGQKGRLVGDDRISVVSRGTQEDQGQRIPATTETSTQGSLPIGYEGDVCRKKDTTTSPVVTVRTCAPGLSCQDTPFAGFAECRPDPNAAQPARGGAQCGSACTADTDCAGAMNCIAGQCVQTINCRGSVRVFTLESGEPNCSDMAHQKNQLGRGARNGCCLNLAEGQFCDPNP